MSEVLRTLAPFSQGYRDLRGLVEPHPILDPTPADQAIAYVGAKEELDRTDAEAAKPPRRRLIENLLHGAALGGGLGYAKGWIASQSPMSPAAIGTGLGMAALGAGVSGAFTLARDKLREKLRGRARKTIQETPDPIKHVADLPKTKDAVDNYAAASWYPYYGAEAGALLGGFGTLAAQYAMGNNQNNGTKFLVGAGLGGAAGLLLGVLMRGRQHRKMLARIRRAVKPRVVEQTGLTQEDTPMQKAAGNRPATASNARMMSGVGKPEKYAAGRRKYGELAKKLAQQAANNIAQQAQQLGIQPTQAQQFVSSKQAPPPTAAPTAPAAPAPVAPTAAPTTPNITGGAMNTTGWAGAKAPTLPQGPKLASAIGAVTGYMLKLSGEVLKGGLGDNKPDSAFDKEDLSKGVASEVKEHGQGPAAKEVAKDHLTEDPQYYAKQAAELPKLRSRAEAIVYSKDGILAIKKDTYLLMPGGGIDDGETPEQAVCREALEEADRKLVNLQKHESIDTLHTQPIMEGYDGERSTFFIAADGGEAGVKHEDKEDFAFIPFSEAKSFLRELIDNPQQAWAADNNRSRLAAVEKAETLKDEPIRKLADVPAFIDKPESLVFNPEGKLLVRRGQNRRFELPGMIPGTRPAPYEDPVRFIPEQGVPEAGFHGYNIGLRLGETAEPVEGFEAADPQEVLRETYASMGLAVNRPYRELDRTRVRALLRYLKKRQQAAAQSAAAAPEPIASTNPVLA